MVTLKAFKGIRPKKNLVKDIAALPYDVVSTEEARKIVEKNNKSFLAIDRAEVNFDKSLNIDVHDDIVYEKASQILNDMIAEGSFIQDDKSCLYIYEEQFLGKKQTGIVFCAAIDDYLNGKIKKHEFTRADKELDRIKHVDRCNANTGPIFLTYNGQKNISNIINLYCDKNSTIYDFISEDNVRHKVWKIDDIELIEQIQKEFEIIESFYIADGHHRAASAVKVGEKRRNEVDGYTGNEEFNYFLAVAFPAQELTIMDYNRVVVVDEKFNLYSFIEELKKKFTVNMLGSYAYKPTKEKSFGMCIKGTWYSLIAKKYLYESKEFIETLDVSILENEILKPLLKIKDVRTDTRIDFIGGIRGLEEVEKRVQEDMDIGFVLYPTKIEDLMKISDEGKIMPPKSTWFEPKLRSGIFIHKLK
ncbi:MAG: DUF1015 domain-containing protein [Sarcina sp.]